MNLKVKYNFSQNNAINIDFINFKFANKSWIIRESNDKHKPVNHKMNTPCNLLNVKVSEWYFSLKVIFNSDDIRFCATADHLSYNPFSCDLMILYLVNNLKKLLNKLNFNQQNYDLLKSINEYIYVDVIIYITIFELILMYSLEKSIYKRLLYNNIK